MTLVTTRHFRELGYCLKSDGSKAFFKKHGLDWRGFIKIGIDSEKLRATGDAMAIRAAEYAENGR